MMRRTLGTEIEGPGGGSGWRSPWLAIGGLVMAAGIVAWYLDRFDTPYQNSIRNTVLANVSVFVCCVPAAIIGGVMILFAFLGRSRRREREREAAREKVEMVAGSVPPLPTCPKCGSVRLNHKLDGHIQCNGCGHEW
jgi:ribosomal protein L32